MVAPAGVNEGVPHDPVTAGGAGVEVTEGLAAEAEQTGAAQTGTAPTQTEPTDTVQADTAKADTAKADTAKAEAKPAGVIPAVVVPAPAESTEGLTTSPGRKPADPAPAEVDMAEAAPAEAGLADTTPAEAGLADPAPAEAEPAVGDPAEPESADGGPTEGELAHSEPAGGAPAEADEDGPDWDAGEEGRNVSPLAVMGIIVGVIALVGVAVGVLAAITHGFRPKTVITYRPAAVFGLRPGECVNSGTNALNVTVVSCKTPHDAEVFALFRLPDTGWPGASAVQQDAGSGCQSRLAGYLNPALATADLTQEYVYPNQAAWQAGERTVVCEVRAASGPLTGSVRATG